MPVVIDVQNADDVLNSATFAGAAAVANALLSAKALVEGQIADQVRQTLAEKAVEANVFLADSAPPASSSVMQLFLHVAVGFAVGGLVVYFATR